MLVVERQCREQQFALHGVARREVTDRHHVHQLVQLLDDLFEGRRFGVDDDRDAREPGVTLGRRDRQ